jgi:hypothetical protein
MVGLERLDQTSLVEVAAVEQARQQMEEREDGLMEEREEVQTEEMAERARLVSARLLVEARSVVVDQADGVNHRL